MRQNLSRRAVKVGAILFLLIWFFPALAPARPTTAEQARRVVAGWLARDGKPLETILGREVREVQSFQGEQEGVDYFAVYLEPRGFVIVSGDDLVEPIIAFAPQGEFDPSPRNPLATLVDRDVPRRVTRAREAEARALEDGGIFPLQVYQEQARLKWQALEGFQAELEYGLPRVSDPRVDPLVKTRWSQDRVADSDEGKACYNYYTPPYAAGTAKNYPSGCVATAMAQILRFHKFPTQGVGKATFWIKVDDRAVKASLRGGDGKGGPYQWQQMPPVPDGLTKERQLKAIGALTHDAGVAIKMEYTSEESSAYTADVGPALINTFKYSNAIVGGAKTGIPHAVLIRMINPNLDASLPVQLGIIKKGTEGGHDVVADGYGYDSSTLYHHLNMGWSGSSDAWYNLPNVDLKPPGNYNLVAECLYNVYTSGKGEIISGRVLDPQGRPLRGAQVQAVEEGGETHTDTTNARGIYALPKVPSASRFTVKASKAGYAFEEKEVTTGTSTEHTKTTGNRWGVDFTAQPGGRDGNGGLPLQQ